MTPVQVVMEKETVVVVVRGDLDAVSAECVGSELIRAARPTPASRCMVIDLRAVTFLDSCGLYALVRARDALLELGIDSFLVVTEDSMARRLVTITGLDAELSIHGRVGDALEAARRCLSRSA